MARKLKGTTTGNDQPAKKKGRPRKPPVQMRMYTDAEKAEAKQRAIDAHEAYLSAQGVMRNKAKAVTAAIDEVAKITAEPKNAVRWALEARKREPKDIDAETRSRTRLAQFFGLAIGTQAVLGLFDDGSSVATKVENGAGDPLERAKQQGYADGSRGKDKQHNFTIGSPEDLAYVAEWNRGQAEIASKFRQGESREPAHA